MEWELITKYEMLSDYKDDIYATIIDKQMSNITGITYSGEKNSQYVTFMMDRYYDGIDLSEKLINICYTIEGTELGGSDAPINVYRNDTQIKFGWLIPPSCTNDANTLTIGILITGKQYEKDYVFKTNTNKYVILQGFISGSGIVEPDNNWFEQFLIQMDIKENESINKINNKTNQSINIINDKVNESSDEIDNMIEQKITDLQQYNVVQILSDGNIRLYYDDTQQINN